jgi:hypothetical protein
MSRARHQATYGELFEIHLREHIERGGALFQVISSVESYQRAPGKRGEEFQAWVREVAAFSCTRCGWTFTAPAELEEETYILCGSCR